MAGYEWLTMPWGAGGEDKESLNKEVKKVSEEEKAKMLQEQLVVNEKGELEKRVVEELLGRRKCKTGYEYEVKWLQMGMEKNTWIEREKLVEMGFVKMVNRMDEREALRLGTSGKALTAREVERALGNMGLEVRSLRRTWVRLIRARSTRRPKVGETLPGGGGTRRHMGLAVRSP